MGYYYYLDSEPPSNEQTNLQLYALREARKHWEDLRNDYEEAGESTDKLKERCVFVLANLGLSISQLLGQNEPTVGADVRYPRDIFHAFVDTHGLDPQLKTEFDEFNYFYNGCRHFGKTTGGKGYDRIDQLTFSVAKECYEFGLKVWRTVIGVYREEEENELEEFEMDESLQE